MWLVDVGDFCEGTPFSTEYKGEADVAAMNASGYDFATFGNHEFSNTLAQLRKLLRLTKHPVVLTNAVDRATGRPLAEPWRIEQVGRVRVGIFGSITRATSTYTAAKEGIDILDEMATARRTVAELRKRADIVVLLSHAGEQTDLRLAAEVPGIDVIVGGHSHSRMPVGQLAWRGDDLAQNDVGGTVIVQAFQWGGELGRLDLLFEMDGTGAWRVSRYRARLIPIGAGMPADPMVASVVDKYWQPIAARFGEVVGRATADVSSRGDDAAAYHFVADAVRETYKVDVELENAGGSGRRWSRATSRAPTWSPWIRSTTPLSSSRPAAHRSRRSSRAMRLTSLASAIGWWTGSSTRPPSAAIRSTIRASTPAPPTRTSRGSRSRASRRSRRAGFASTWSRRI